MGRGGSTGLHGADLAGAVKRLPGEMHAVILEARQFKMCFTSNACRIKDIIVAHAWRLEVSSRLFVTAPTLRVMSSRQSVTCGLWMDADDTRASLLYYGKTVLHVTCSYAIHLSVVVLALYLRVRVQPGCPSRSWAATERLAMSVGLSDVHHCNTYSPSTTASQLCPLCCSGKTCSQTCLMQAPLLEMYKTGELQSFWQAAKSAFLTLSLVSPRYCFNVVQCCLSCL